MEGTLSKQEPATVKPILQRKLRQVPQQYLTNLITPSVSYGCTCTATYIRVHNITLWDTTNYHANQTPLFTLQFSENTRCCKPHNVFLVRQGQLRITFVKKMPSRIQILPKSRTNTESWILLTPPDIPQVNTTSSIKMSPHITWDKVKLVINAQES